MAVVAWGFGKLGQLGTGDRQSRASATKMRVTSVAGGDRAAQVSVGGLCTMVLTLKGDLHCCGCAKYGRLGTGTEDDELTLARVEPARDTKLSMVSTGSWHACAVTYMGRVYSWGYNSKHRVLGRETGAERCSLRPGLVAALLGVKVKAVSCGHNFTLACSTEGLCYSWGCGRYGVLGHGSESCVLEPKRIESLERVAITKVDAGYAHCAVISEDGSSPFRLFTFGKGWDGALGVGTDVNNRWTPVWVNDNHSPLFSVVFTAASCSVEEHRGHTLALSSTGEVYAFGSNSKGKLGLGDTVDRLVPTLIPRSYFNEDNVVDISAGGTHSGAVTEEGRVFTWGCGKDGRLGHSDYASKPHSYHCTKPKQVTDGDILMSNRRAVQIACSHYHTVLLFV